MMIKNYLKIAIRNVRRHPGYTFINVTGLALGLGSFYLIVLFLQHELSFDQFHDKADRIVRLTYGVESSGAIENRSANSAAGFAPLLEANVPEIENIVRTENFRSPYIVLNDGEMRRLEGLLLADAPFFEVFDFTLLRGEPTVVLQDKYALVLTESTARSLFGNIDVIGQRIRYGDNFDLTVTGIMADVPATSHFRFNAVAPFLLVEEFVGAGELEGFTNYNYNTYLLLQDRADRTAVTSKITTVVRQRFDEGNAPDDDPSRYMAQLQPITDIHLTTGLNFDVGGHRDVRSLYAFGAIGLLILLIACVNFMNLATARAAQRAAEVGVRKAIGAQKTQLVGQFIGESVLLSIISVLIGIGLAAIALPFFNEAVSGTTRFSFARIDALFVLIMAGLGAGLLAGSYPAFYLSSFRPTRVLKGDISRGGGAPLLRKGLIVFQFAASIFLAIATFTVYGQLQYMQNRDLGFSKEQVIFFSPPRTVRTNYDSFRETLVASPYITNVSLTGGVPGRVNTNRGYNWPGQVDNDEQEGASFWSVFADPDYLDVFDMELIAGRTFSKQIVADTNDTYLLNEKAIQQMGWRPEEAVGQPFRAWDRPMGRIIGVVKNFHFQSLHQEVQPLVFNFKPAWMGTVALRTSEGGVRNALNHLEASWPDFAGGFPLEYRFLDEDFGRLYQNEARLGSLFAFFAAIAVFIACLGLFGLAAYTAQRRTKEIGVRKVLGASPQGLVLLLSKEFLQLVLLSLIVAAPAAYFVMNRWLESFAYRIDVNLGVFLLTGLLALVIAFATVSTQAYRAASLDPVKSLRYD